MQLLLRKGIDKSDLPPLDLRPLRFDRRSIREQIRLQFDGPLREQLRNHLLG